MTNADPARSQRYLKPSRNSAIVPQENSFHQCFLSIKRRRLTEVIETLESLGFSGDIAVFILACLQRGVV